MDEAAEGIDAREILKQNYRGEEGSFIYYLHEEGKFDKKSFWRYHDCLCELAQRPHKEKFSQEILVEVNHTYAFILECILYHFISDDLYQIKSFPKANYERYIERLDLAIEAFFKDIEIDEMYLRIL